MNRLEALKSNSSATRCNAIVSCIENGNVTASEIAIIESLLNDEHMIVGRKISSFAKAALDILGMRKNDGDLDAQDLIKAFS